MNHMTIVLPQPFYNFQQLMRSDTSFTPAHLRLDIRNNFADVT